MHVQKSKPIYSLLTNNSDGEQSNEATLGSWSLLRKYKLLIALVGFTILIFYIRQTVMQRRPEDTLLVFMQDSDSDTDTADIKDGNNNIAVTEEALLENQQIIGNLVSNERCKIPDINPFQSETMDGFIPLNYTSCSWNKYKPLTRVVYNATKQCYTLKIIKEHIQFYSHGNRTKCCFQSIKRDVYDNYYADFKVSMSKYICFKHGVHLPPTVNNIIVTCSAYGREIYRNGYAMMPEREVIRKRIDKWKSTDRENQQNATSIVMIGIDSLSRINLIRAMPKLAQYLYAQDNEWFEMSGYNKIDDNTFPNLMAALSGLNLTTIKKKCLPEGVNVLDNCSSIIWNTFREHGYVTAYGEDETWINTFNLITRGFAREPVDFYLRPFLLKAEKWLGIRYRGPLRRCIGYRDSSDYIFDYAKELVTRFKHDSYFGLFWMSSFSHNELNDPSSMDDHIVESLKNFMSLDTFENTIVIFFSDHGLRFGPYVKTLSGYYEERLPFLFLWLPKQLRESHPDFVDALSVNKNRLTNPYDLHMTLKHVLALSKRVTDQELLAPAEDCPRCQTLFAPVPYNRSCDDIAIDYHWCACIRYQRVQKNNKNVLKLVKLTIDYMNHIVTTFENGTWANRCEQLSLLTVDSAYHANHMDNKSDDFYRFSFYTMPNTGLFSATVLYNELSGSFKVSGQISRLNEYSKDASCIRGDPREKKYCSCRLIDTSGLLER